MENNTDDEWIFQMDVNTAEIVYTAIPFNKYLLIGGLIFGYLSARFSTALKPLICLSSIYFVEGFFIAAISLVPMLMKHHKTLIEISSFFFIIAISSFVSFFLFIY